MLPLHLLLIEFKLHLKVPHAIIDHKFKKDKFNVVIYCKQVDIDVQKEQDFFERIIC